MKKLIFFTLFILFIMPRGVFAAAESSAAGKYYHSDIKTYFYGAPITSYNLGGRTAIVCEDLNWHYNHDVYWYEEQRQLNVTKKNAGDFTSPQAQAGETLKTADGTPGEIAGNIYASDIKTYLNNIFINSYNIGGQTVIICEDMRTYGYDVTWDANTRSLYITDNDSNFKAYADIGAVTELSDGRGTYGIDMLSQRSLLFNGSPIEVDPPYTISSTYSPVDWVPLVPTLNALGATWIWNGEDNIFTVTSGIDQSKIKPAELIEYEMLYVPGHTPTIKLKLYAGGREVKMTETVIIGHMQNMHEETHELNAILVGSGSSLNSGAYDGIVYAPLAAIADCLGLEVTDNGSALINP